MQERETLEHRLQVLELIESAHHSFDGKKFAFIKNRNADTYQVLNPKGAPELAAMKPLTKAKIQEAFAGASDYKIFFIQSALG